jgi:hypothetical protein
VVEHLGKRQDSGPAEQVLATSALGNGTAFGPFVAAARFGFGISLLLRPERIVRMAAGGHVDRKRLVVARVLGARHLLEGTALGISAAPAVAWLGAGVDALHAATAGALALVDEKDRRLLMINAGVALGFSLTGAYHARALDDGR